MSAITPFVQLKVVSAEELAEDPAEPAQLLAPAPDGRLDQASRPPVVLAVPDSGVKEESRDATGREAADSAKYRKRGRPRKYEGLDEEERRKRRMCVSSHLLPTERS